MAKLKYMITFHLVYLLKLNSLKLYVTLTHHNEHPVNTTTIYGDPVVVMLTGYPAM